MRDRIEQTFLASLAAADIHESPYRHLMLENCLPLETARAIADLPFEVPEGLEFAGRREVNNSKRIYFNPPNRDQYEVCDQLADVLDRPSVRAAISRMGPCQIDDALLRIEYCQDTDGFWLEPHTDIAVKKFTMLIYLSDDPNLADAGTDIYLGPPDFKHLGTAPYAMNAGLIFVPGKDTWHGVEKRPIRGVRKSIIVNFVAQDWRERWELSARGAA